MDFFLKKEDRVLALGFLILAPLFFLFTYKLLPKNQKKIEPAPVNFVPPTLSLEEEKIAEKISTHKVTIKNSKLYPEILEIKTHDQVIWENEDDFSYTIKGQDWGNVPLEPGEKYTQAFDQSGNFTYTLSPNIPLQGVIVVQN